MIKVLMGYDLAPGVSAGDHDRWLREIHLADMARVPGLERVVLNRTEKAVIGEDPPQFVAELHYPDLETYLAARRWIARNPFPKASRPDGVIAVRFMILCDSDELASFEPDRPRAGRPPGDGQG